MMTTKTLESPVQPTKGEVTGAAVLITGIGRVTALALAREGARIAVSGRNDDNGKKLVSELPNSALKLPSSNPTFAMRKKCAMVSTTSEINAANLNPPRKRGDSYANTLAASPR
jgi:NAD(P)-dependent dehydrogenase (short-subunit alcohol dehydrogenase family)